MGEDSSTNDDFECLPDIFENITRYEETSYNVVQGDIVWAEFRNLYWPALVRQVIKKDKKVSVWYLDSPRKCFKLPYKKIKNFDCPKISEQVRKEAENSDLKEHHERTLIRTLDYLRRKANGEHNDPAKFFDLACPYLVLNRCALSDKPNDSTTTEEEQVDAFDENDPDEDIDYYFLKKSEIDESNHHEPLNEETESIVSFVVSGKADKHLLKVRAKGVASKWQKLYDETIDKKMLMYQVSYVPVKSIDALKDMATHLMNLFEKDIGGFKDEMVVYVTSVWLPEAIGKALLVLKENSLEVEDEKIDSTPPDKTSKAAETCRKPSKHSKNKKKKVPLFKQAKRKLKFEKDHHINGLLDANDVTVQKRDKMSEILSDHVKEGTIKVSTKRKTMLKVKHISAERSDVRNTPSKRILRNCSRIDYAE